MSAAGASFEQELLAIFAQEGVELLEQMEQELLAIEFADEERQRAGMQEVRRNLHTLKGAAGALGISPIIRICHELEEGTASERPPLTPQGFEAFYQAITYMYAQVSGESGAPFEEVFARVREAFDSDSAELEIEPEEEEQSPEKKDERPSSSAQETDGPVLTKTSVVRVGSERIDDLQAVAGELVVLNLQQEGGREQAEKIRDLLAGLQAQWRTLQGELSRSAEDPARQRARVTRGAQEFTRRLKEAYQASFDFARWTIGHSGQLGQITSALDDGLRTIRMQPLGPFFDSYARIARDIARDEGKRVRFETRGREIEVDRAVLERLREPMLHLVRNAVAHGIEGGEERRRLGKDVEGILRLEAERIGERVCLQVRDDGSGVDVERLWKRALAMGVGRPEEEVDERRLLELMALPGLSTREEADTLAGRGIGLDAVEAAVAELGGSLELINKPGEGAQFRMLVPTSITTTKGLILAVGPYRLGIQFEAVERIVRVAKEDVQRLEGQEVFYHQGDPLALRSLAEILGAADAAPDLSQGHRLALILRNNNQRFVAVVDDVLGEMPMVIKPLGAQFSRVQYLSGGAIQADGSVLPVLEHRELFRVVAGQRFSMKISAPAETTEAESVEELPQPEAPRVLAVDDSATTRALIRTILEGAGYQVSTAGDGAEALRVLEREPQIELVVTDLEMPRMGGLELCQAIRGGERSALPIIIVTSRGAPEEIQRGMEAGADAYIVKGRFEQDHFMKTVNRFVG